jgi:hypothetical protein
MSNPPRQQAQAAAFGALYHCCWRIAEAFRRRKHRLKLEAVSGLSQHALTIDVAAKVLADKLCSLMCAQAPTDKRCAPTAALHILQRA